MTAPQRLALLIEVLRTYVLALVLRRRAPLPEVVRRLRRVEVDRAPRRSDEHAEAVYLAWATRRSLGLVPSDTRCLMQSLTLVRLLARRGIPATLKLSAATVPTFESHAWVEHAGRAVLEPAHDGHQVLLEL